MSNLRRPANRLLSRDGANEVLAGYFDEFVASVQAGLNQFVTLATPLQADCRPRTLANILNDVICADARKRFADAPGVVIDEEYDGNLFIFDGRVGVRFKKVDASLAPRNILTKRQLRIREQQCELDGINRLTIVNLGYRPNEAFTEVTSVSLSCRRGTSLVWEIPLADALTAYLFDQRGNAAPIGAPVVRSKLTGKAKNG